MTVERAERLTQKQLELCCMGDNYICIHCRSEMPNDIFAPRPCPAWNSIDEIVELERIMREAKE